MNIKHLNKNIALLAFIIICFKTNAQIGVNTATPEGALDVSSSTQGFVPPRLALSDTTTQAPVVNPQTGAIPAGTIVWNTATAGVSPNNVAPGLYFWDSSRWVAFAGSPGGLDWSLTGNSGTTTSTNFIGTTNNNGLMIKTNNTNKFEISNNGRIRAFASGLPTLPIYSWDVDNDTGMYRSGANSLAFATNGIQRVRIDGSGRTFINYAGDGVSTLGVGNDAAGTNKRAIYGRNIGDGIGVFGYNEGTGRGIYGANLSGVGYGVYGQASNGGVGVYGISENSGYGIHGENTSTGGGVFGETLAAGSVAGVLGENTSVVGVGGSGVHGISNSIGNYGVLGENTAFGGVGVYGISENSGYGIHGENTSTGGGVFGETLAPGSVAGVLGENTSVVGVGGSGVHGISNSTGNYGVLGENTAFVAGGSNEYGVFSIGDLGGTGAKTFRIDHPLDPENKYLSHFSIESNEVLNVYRGVETFNFEGKAIVTLPDYYGEINKNPSYQLTAIGASMPDLYVLKEVSNGVFVISGGITGKKVSWQITAERNDLYIRSTTKRKAESEKPESEKGKYQIPELYSQPKEKGIFYKKK